MGDPFEKGVALHLKKLESHLPKNALWKVKLKIAQWLLRTDRRATGGQKNFLEPKAQVS